MKNRISKLLIAGCGVFMALGGLTACKADEFDGLTINFWHTFGKTPADALEEKAKNFASLVEKNENVKLRVKLTYKGTYNEMPGYITKSFASSETPTLAVAYPDHVADYFAAESTPGQYVVNLEKYINDATIGFGKEAYLGDSKGVDDFVEAFIDEGRHYTRTGTYSLPYMKSSEVMFYNMGVLKKAMPYYDPSISTEDDIIDFMNNITWDELMDLSEVILDNKADILPTLIVPTFYDSDGNMMISKMFQEEIPFSSIKDGKGVIDFDGTYGTPTEAQKEAYNETVDLLLTLKKGYDKGLFTTKGAYGKYGSEAFVNQQSVFSIGSSGGAGYNFPESKEIKINICKVPAQNDNPLYVSQGPSLTMFNSPRYTASENEQLTKYAWKFLKYITNPEVNSNLCTKGSEGYIPVRESAYSTADFLSFLEKGENYAKVAKIVINEISGSYLSTAVFKGSATLRTEIAGALTDCLTKIITKDAQGQITKTDEQIKTEIKANLDRCLANTHAKM